MHEAEMHSFLSEPTPAGVGGGAQGYFAAVGAGTRRRDSPRGPRGFRHVHIEGVECGTGPPVALSLVLGVFPGIVVVSRDGVDATRRS